MWEGEWVHEGRRVEAQRVCPAPDSFSPPRVTWGRGRVEEGIGYEIPGSAGERRGERRGENDGWAERSYSFLNNKIRRIVGCLSSA